MSTQILFAHPLCKNIFERSAALNHHTKGQLFLWHEKKTALYYMYLALYT